ncbi:hypothetical protein Cni_G13418 [Canna indica]|uniref:HAT C-terminal dimerisation domain-containing protein n=1 Tax=Canna indica TaxID=4628 RepID=A0AAQ3QCP0_9LILI|nr:hypothetical protein Cni_G13418 [Canna indica]
MCDSWTGPTRMSIINFLIYCNRRVIYHKSVNASDEVHNVVYISKLMKEVIEKNEPQNFVQIITDNGANFKRAGEIIELDYSHIYARTTDGKQTEKYILNTRFWDCVAEIVVAIEPLYKVLRQVDMEKTPQMGHLYHYIHQAQEEIKRVMISPTKEAAQALNESRYFRDSSDNFGDTFAISCQDSIDPVEWWLQFGTEAPTLRKIATCILSQTTSSSGCERNWSTFALIHTEPCNRLSYARLEMLVYVHYNMRLRMRTLQNGDIQHVDTFDVEFVQDDADPIIDWWSAMESDQPLLDEPGKPPRPSPIISDALESESQPEDMVITPLDS